MSDAVIILVAVGAQPELIAEIERLRKILDLELRCCTCGGTGVMQCDCPCVLDYPRSDCPHCKGTGKIEETCAECDGARVSFRSDEAKAMVTEEPRT